MPEMPHPLRLPNLCQTYPTTQFLQLVLTPINVQILTLTLILILILLLFKTMIPKRIPTPNHGPDLCINLMFTVTLIHAGIPIRIHIYVCVLL